MDIEVEVVNQHLRFPSNLKDYVGGSQNFVRFKFNFTSDWSKLKTFAQFGQNGLYYNVYLDSNNCVYLPPEIQAGKCTLSLYGSYGNTIATSDLVELRVQNGSVVSASGLEVSASLYNQLVTQIVDIQNWKDENEESMLTTWIEF